MSMEQQPGLHELVDVLAGSMGFAAVACLEQCLAGWLDVNQVVRLDGYSVGVLGDQLVAH